MRSYMWYFGLGFWSVARIGLAEPTPEAGPLYRMPLVHISASRLDQGLAVAGRDVLVIGSEEIRRRAPHDIAELLDGLPGIEVRSRGSAGAQGDIEMRGATYSQILILLDGVRVSDPQTGHHTLNLPIAPDDLERVEVVYGGGSSVHGPDAFGGIVNLVPRRQSSARLAASTHWGEPLDDSSTSAVEADAGLRLSWIGDRGSAWIAGHKRRSGGYRATTDLDENRLFASTLLDLAGGELKLQSGVQDKEFGANGFYAPVPSWEHTRAWIHSAQYGRLLGRGAYISTRVHHRRHRDRFVLTVEDPALYENRHLNQRLGLETHLSVPAGAHGRLVLGGEIGREIIDSSNLGDRAQRRWAAFAEYGCRQGLWALNTGVRLDHHQVFGWMVAPSLGATRWLGAHRVFAAAHRAYRSPSFTELYYRDPLHVGDPRLDVEQSWSGEAGMVLEPVADWEIHTEIFARRETHVIDYVRPVDTPPWQAQNLGRMTTEGAQVRVLGRWRWLSPHLTYTWIHKEQTLASGLESKYAFTHPRHQLGLRLDHPLGGSLVAGWQVSARTRGRQGDYAVADLTVSRAMGRGLSRLRIRNLTDTRYDSVPGLPAPGRWFSLEMQLPL